MFWKKKKQKPDVMTLQCRTCRKEQKHDTNDTKNWPECHGTRMPVLRRQAKWPDVPFQCPRCGSGGVREHYLGSFNQGSRGIRYDCQTTLVSDMANDWYIAIHYCTEWDWQAKEED